MWDVQWANKGYPSLITDPAPLNEVGGPKKIDSIQNVVLLRSDLRDAWDSYRFAVNPDVCDFPFSWHLDTSPDNEYPQRGYVVIPFVRGYEDIAGKVLKLDHIEDPNHRPLDELFRDHFLQCVLRNMKGVAEPLWDKEDAFGDGSMDLSRDIWASKSGKEHLEFEMANRMFGLKVAQEIGP